MKRPVTGAAGGADEVPDIEEAHSARCHDFSSAEIGPLRASLLDWYRAHRRPLPWRGDSGETVAAFFDAAAATGRPAGKAPRSAPQTSTLDSFLGLGKRKERPPASQAWRGAAPPPLPPDPYAVWVSEIMCQQTRVETVLGFYSDWMRKFPTVASLAAASEDEVNHAWAGLGFYRRVRFLHRGAKYLVEHHGGQLPRTAAELRQIPGIGPYTAGAISSVCFGEQEPVVDGNVGRVLSRLRAVLADPLDSGTSKLFWRLARELVPPESPGDFNQAVMELGALVCTPMAPSCGSCPVQAHCLAHAVVGGAVLLPRATSEHSNASTSPPPRPQQQQQQHETPPDSACRVCDFSTVPGRRPSSVTAFPLPKRRKVPREEVVAVCVVTAGDDSVLLVRRPEGGLLAGQWECPSVVVRVGESVVPPTDDWRARVDEVLLRLGLADPRAAVRREVAGPPIVHVFSHVRHTMVVDRLQVPESQRKIGRVADGAEVQWATRADLAAVGLTSGVRKVLQAALGAAWVPAGGRKRRDVANSAPTSRPTKRRRKSDSNSNTSETSDDVDDSVDE